MGKIKITYPIICFETLEVELPDEKVEDVMNYCQQEQADFIKEMVAIHQPENEDWISGLTSALDTDYASIKRI